MESPLASIKDILWWLTTFIEIFQSINFTSKILTKENLYILSNIRVK